MILFHIHHVKFLRCMESFIVEISLSVTDIYPHIIRKADKNIQNEYDLIFEHGQSGMCLLIHKELIHMKLLVFIVDQCYITQRVIISLESLILRQSIPCN